MPMTSDLKMKNVVNVLDGKQLEAVTDIELDAQTGKLTAIVIPRIRGCFGIWGRNEDIIISWNNITTIGDCILVETQAFTGLQDPKEASIKG